MTELYKHMSNLLFFTSKKVGVIRPLERAVFGGYCDAGTDRVSSIATDPNQVNILYMGTEKGQILVFDMASKNDNFECKLRYKLTTDAQ